MNELSTLLHKASILGTCNIGISEITKGELGERSEPDMPMLYTIDLRKTKTIIKSGMRR